MGCGKNFRIRPCVFAINREYQIYIPFEFGAIVWIEVNGKKYYDDSNGILRSNNLARYSVINNRTSDTVKLKSVSSVCLDFEDCDFDSITMYGSWTRERSIERYGLRHGDISVSSLRGASGHHSNPFMALARKDANEDFGEVYGISLIYSGDFDIRVNVGQFDTVRMIAGINPDTFEWQLKNTAEYYTNNIYYVHGSLDENDIILGYDEPNFACLAQFDDIYWSKSICREMLAFRRLLKKGNSNYGDEKTKERIDSLEKYLNYENSGRGIDDEVKDLIPNYDFISNFHNDEINTFVIKDIDFNNIKKIVVIGNGIEADITFLADMLKKCINLREVEIFKYENEPDESIDRKIKFFLEYCQNITLKAY